MTINQNLTPRPVSSQPITAGNQTGETDMQASCQSPLASKLSAHINGAPNDRETYTELATRTIASIEKNSVTGHLKLTSPLEKKEKSVINSLQTEYREKIISNGQNIGDNQFLAVDDDDGRQVILDMKNVLPTPSENSAPLRIHLFGPSLNGLELYTQNLIKWWAISDDKVGKKYYWVLSINVSDFELCSSFKKGPSFVDLIIESNFEDLKYKKANEDYMILKKSLEKHLQEKDKEKKMLLIVNGLDELTCIRNEIETELEKLLVKSQTDLIFSSQKLPYSFSFKDFEILGLSDNGTLEYVKKHFTLPPKSLTYQKEITDFIQNNPFVAKICRSPSILTVVHLSFLCLGSCYLEQCSNRKIMQVIVGFLCLDYLQQRDEICEEQMNDSSIEWATERCRDELLFLEYFAVFSLVRDITFDKSEPILEYLNNFFDKDSNIQLDILPVLSPATLNQKGKRLYCFAEKCLQDYFVARFLIKCETSKDHSLIAILHEALPYNSLGNLYSVEEFITKCVKKNSRCEEILEMMTFLCQ